MSNGYILYEGPSRLNGDPIVVIVTGVNRPSKNSKTGAMLQVWIMCQDVSPVEAVKALPVFAGIYSRTPDSAICGDCKHKPSNLNSCYVNLGQAPLGIWKAYKRGIYPTAPKNWRSMHQGPVRWGAYGDPLAMPRGIFKVLRGDTAYTHQWRRFDPNGAMASVDSKSEFIALAVRGIDARAFRVTAEDDLWGDEIWCPATKEGGLKTNCVDCGLCAGVNGMSIAVMVHGSTAGNFT